MNQMNLDSYPKVPWAEMGKGFTENSSKPKSVKSGQVAK